MSTAGVSGTKATIGCESCGKLNRIDFSRAASGPRCGACGSPIRLDKPIVATDATLERILRDAELPVLVDFYADWCGPCKIMAPLLDGLARSRSGRALIVKLDTDRNPISAGRYGIRGIPTLIKFGKGAESQRQVGAVPKEVLEGMV